MESKEINIKKAKEIAQKIVEESTSDNYKLEDCKAIGDGYRLRYCANKILSFKMCYVTLDSNFELIRFEESSHGL